MERRIARGVLTLVGSILGYQGANYILHLLDIWPQRSLEVTVFGWSAGIFLGGSLAFLLTPFLIDRLMQIVGWAEVRLQKVPPQDMISGAIGLIVGLIIANLLVFPFSRLPVVGQFLPFLSSILFGYLGVSVAVKKREEIINFPSLFPKLKDKMNPLKTKLPSKLEDEKFQNLVACKILDTSVIIDGRIADISETGFLEGTLVVPSFVLEELRHIADSSDALKRNRGRRGLDILNKMQKQEGILIKIYEDTLDDSLEVDSKLVKLAQILNGKILTNDYNLNKVAELQGVGVLNINELANAVKAIVLPGEEILISIIKEGKEAGQGVAYLEDGTMIVVDGGRKFIGELITIVVTSVLQTAAGRMIFAKPKGVEKAI